MKKVLYHFEEIIGCSVLLFMMVILFLQVNLRYVLNTPITQIEELARYCMVWMTFLGASYCAKKHVHVEVSYFFDLIPSMRVKKALQVFVNLLVSATFLLLMKDAINFVIIQMSVKSPSMSALPLGVVFLAFPIGISLMCFWYIYDIVQIIRGKPLNEQSISDKGAN